VFIFYFRYTTFSGFLSHSSWSSVFLPPPSSKRAVPLRQFSATGVPPLGFRCAANFYKKLYIRTLSSEKGSILSFVIRIRNTHARAHTHTHTHTHTGSSSLLLCAVLFSNACVLIGQGLYVDAYLWPCIVSYLLLCGVPSCV
jgi:hypothetical protein